MDARKRLYYYLQCSEIPGYDWVENRFQVPKEHIRIHEIWDIEDLRAPAEEGSASLSQQKIK
jgi:hypothetical protein